jgi:RecA-family ATPase
MIVDALADAFAGDENNRTQARQFVGLLKRIANQYKCTVLCLAHPSLYGMNSGSGTSGSTGWSNSVRSRLYFESAKASGGEEPDDDLRTLSTKKINYAGKSVPLTLRWKAGAFVPEGGMSSIDKAALEQKAEHVFMDLLRLKREQGIDVTPFTGGKYAPKIFANEEKAKGIGQEHLVNAMRRLLDRKVIRNKRRHCEETDQPAGLRQ